MRDHYWMEQALRLAETAAQQNEVPIGAVLVLNDACIGQGWNQPISTNDPTAHAEIIALREGAKRIQNYRLVNTTLYVTVEPCLMCLGAIQQARIHRVVFGTHEPRSGAVESALSLKTHPSFFHTVHYHSGLLADPCRTLLIDFFRAKRSKSS